MQDLDALDRFDLGTHGDSNEVNFWPILRDRFPSYEILWRRLIVPLTCRIDLQTAGDPFKSVEFREGIPAGYEPMAMAHYSIFYFLGRALKRFTEDTSVRSTPEDILSLLDSVSDNFKLFRDSINTIARDCGLRVFDASYGRFPRGFEPFEEISDYRNILLHNPVLIKAIDGGEIYIPKWSANKGASPLEEAKGSWRAARKLPPGALVSTKDLLNRLIDQACSSLDTYWRLALLIVRRPEFEEKFVRTTGVAKHFPLPAPVVHRDVPAAPGSYPGIGSNTSFRMPWARSDSYNSS